jgi:hypothetical protein
MPSLVADSLQIVTLATAIRTVLPKVDGWPLVALVFVLSIGAGFMGYGRDWPAALEHGVQVFMGAFGGYNAMRRLLREGRPPVLEAPAPSTPKPPAVPPLPLLVLVAFGASACASPLQVAVGVANGAALAGEAAAPLIEAKCTVPMRAAADAKDVEAAKKVASICDPVVGAYEGLRVSHVALRGAIVVAAAGGDLAKVWLLVADVSAAAASLTTYILAVKDGAK